LFGGFPCQDVSVAGKRAGLSGERSGLWFEFRRIVSELRPNWVVIENVPGLLSSHSGRDFTTILLGLEELGYGWAYRVLDARWFGVPQRRRRVFIVGCAGGAARAASVLAVCEGCGGHPAPRREARQDVAYALAASARGTGDGHGNAWNSTYIAPAFTVPSAHRGVGNGWNTNYVPEDAIAWDDRNQAADDVHHTLRGAGLQRSDVVLAATLSGGGHPGSNMPGRHKEDDQNLVVGNTLLKGGHSNNPLDDNLVVGSQIDAGQARPLVARASGYRMDLESENFIVADTLRTEYGQQSFRGDGADNLIAGAFYSTGGSHELHDDPTSSPAVNVGTGMGMPSPPAIAYGAGVRRLTPRECERLMGWPDDWTRWTADGQEIPDSHRYRLCGNGVVSVVAEWLGHRLVWMDAQ
jgi:DNA (cytosine-5)-methyltransferase 1